MKRSILISFIGNQDPFARKKSETDPDTEGSLVSMVKHLQLEQERQFIAVFLLYSQATEMGAKDTRDWLITEYELDEAVIQLMPISQELSDDPINVTLATLEARKALDQAQEILDREEADWIDFNASSGTPAMKQTWGILQAAGYANDSNVWQVRDPNRMQPGQERVFTMNLKTLKTEFDFKVVSRLLDQYDYAGADSYLALSKGALNQSLIRQLLQYGRTRLSFDFEEADKKAAYLTSELSSFSLRSLKNLKERDSKALVREIYWKAKIRAENRDYSDFLVLVFAFIEQRLRIETKESLGIPQYLWNKEWEKSPLETKVYRAINEHDNGKLRQYINKKKKEKNWKYESLNRPMLLIIATYFKSPHLEAFKSLDKYAPDRNKYVHEMEGVSLLNESTQILQTMKVLVKSVVNLPEQTPFDTLNQLIREKLEHFR